ncbi:MAG: Obg family GTPase CgtA, partial [Dehalococcoidia bacterium]
SLSLELRLLADVGIIGLPNAGMSTLLSAVSNAKPKIASYPFTTLEPMLGVVNVGWERFTLADLPGLVEGASEGYGLGFEFLKHIRRCRVLLHLIDSTSPDPVTDYELIETELKAYDAKLDDVARVVAVSKADLDEAAAEASAQVVGRHTGTEVAVVSAEVGTGMESLAGLLMAMVKDAKLLAASEPGEEELVVLRPASAERFSAEQLGPGRFRVEGPGPVTFVEMMNLQEENARFEIFRRMERWGVGKALRRAGAKPGDTLVFGEAELVWGE